MAQETKAAIQVELREQTPTATPLSILNITYWILGTIINQNYSLDNCFISCQGNDRTLYPLKGEKMLFIWNDKTYWKRYKESTKIQVKVLLPVFVISFILWKIFLGDDVKLIPILLVSFLSAGVVYTFISIFLQFPNERIPDTYSSLSKKLLYIGHFLAVSFGLYIVIVKIIFKF